MTKARIWIAATLTIALAAGLWLAGTSTAGDNKDLLASVDKIAAALQKGDKDGAKKQAESLAKKMDDVAEVMDLFKPRKKNGFGVGKTPGAINPDGIEQMLLKIGRDAPTAGFLGKESASLEEMGNRIAAIGMIAAAKGAPKSSKGTAKDWNGWSNETVAGGLAVAAAAKTKAGAEVKGAASKLNNSCNSCHTVFR